MNFVETLPHSGHFTRISRPLSVQNKGMKLALSGLRDMIEVVIDLGLMLASPQRMAFLLHS